MIIKVRIKTGHLVIIDATDMTVAQMERLASLNSWNIIEFRRK